jgi:ComF family protein
MAAQIAATAPPGALERGELVPVPLHPARRRRRGFNQAERLASALARRTGLAVADCLERTGPRGTQMGRDREERLAALAEAVRVRRGAPAPREAILVDDVLTTGATVLACARALRSAGCGRVVAVAYTRTPGR